MKTNNYLNLSVLLLFLITVLFFIVGCANSHNGNKADSHNINETENWEINEVKEVSKEAIKIYWGHRDALFDGDAKNKLKRGGLILHYPAVEEYYNETDINVEEINKDKNEVEVVISIKYPYVKSNHYLSIKDEIEKRILSKASKENICFRKIFSEVLEKYDMSQEKTTKKVVITKKDGELTVVDIDKPQNIFSSFDNLYKEAVVENINEIKVKSDKNKMFREKEDIVEAKYGKEDIKLEYFKNHNCKLIDPYYFSDKTKIILPSKDEIPLKALWEEVVKQVDYSPYITNITPASYFDQILHGGNIDNEKVTILLSRPYFSASESTIVGFFNKDTKEINLFDVIGARVGPGYDLLWCPKGDYAAYSWTTGIRSKHLNVYNHETDEIIEVSKMDKFIKETDRVYKGDFKDIQWQVNENQNYLLFKTSHDNKHISWKLDVEKKKLFKLNN